MSGKTFSERVTGIRKKNEVRKPKCQEKPSQKSYFH